MIPEPSATPVLHSTALYTAAAEALAGMLPTGSPVDAVLQHGARDAGLLDGPGELVSAGFVGQHSADVLLQVAAPLLGGAPGGPGSLVAASDVLRPALEAATGVLGAGVLSTEAAVRPDALLGDSETVCFELRSAGEKIGFFAIRIRENDPAPAPQAPGAGVREDMSSKLGRINNVEMALTVEIGRTRMSVRDVLGLEPGAVVELDRSAGAPADILLNGRLIALGEVVVMDQDYGVRITQILDVNEGLS
ncbi:flagellar motor switch protein FliN [Arthrobacter sp. UCD-GKA]|jgi:flagellar motor switch protein FliN/FliY|uniref:flagellar motor switch protein FliN n=1 Tax=Arthrobacter sp. UCD-GKA TaxID=1913576 RepID=UPI0008DDB916|nr:flagellar motor switch protein FliN [Arthrobacter sp. UCD-GKA]OIH86781.1 flagellar motor switch protein FliN [Arthrobacter sp. UCD-GKA]